MYSVMSYGHMAADGVRMDAYARAIARAIGPGSVVLDLGAGTGILSLIAARAGARMVYAVDTNPAVLLLKELARENGVADRIEVHHKSSFDVTLPERVDVVVSDLRGGTPFNGEHFAVVRDARERFLKPGGRLMPAQDRLMVALVASPRLERDLESALVGFTRQGFSAAATRASMLNTVFADSAGELTASSVLSSSERWATLDYASVEPGVVEGSVVTTALRAGDANALAVWFETTVIDGLGYSTAPGFATVYTRTLLPLEEPIALTAEDRIDVTLRASSRGDRWAWETSVHARDGEAPTRFRQATFLGMPTSPTALLRAASTFTPARSPLGDRALRILEAMDGTHSVTDIAAALAPSATEASLPSDVALDEVRDAVLRYAR